MKLIEVKVPDIGDFHDVAVIELLVKPGDTVRAEQSLLTVESDKASMEIPSSASGVVKELRVKLGDKVSQGTVVLELEVNDSQASPATSPVAAASNAVAAPAAAASPAVTTPTPADTVLELRVPDIGDFKDVAVIEVMVKPGDSVKVEQSLITVESDKASMEIPASAAGVLAELKVKVGDKVSQGSLVGLVKSSASSPGSGTPARTTVPAAAIPQASQATAAPASVPSASGQTPESQALPVARVSSDNPATLPHASPSVRKFARELGVPLERVKGSGPKGRITQEDVQGFTAAVMRGDISVNTTTSQSQAGGSLPGLLPWPVVDFTKFGPVERRDVGRIRKISAANLHRNWVMIPHVTNHDDADITELEAFRVQTNRENEKTGVKVTMLAFLIKACIAALKKFPEFNASLDGEQLVLKQYYHIGFAADTPNGLMVPVIRDADKKGVLQISQELSELARKAREGKLSPGEMTGASFTISSLGGIGGRYFTPIINAPEVAILGVCKSTMEPIWNGKEFVPRLMLPLSLSWDHRVIDGALAARFNVFVAQILGDFRRVLL